MLTLLINRNICTQNRPSLQLSDDLGGAMEHFCGWPSCPGCRHIPDSPQTPKPLCLTICFSGQQVGWGYQPEGVVAGLCFLSMLPEPGLEQVRRASGYITVVIFLPCMRICDSQDSSHPFLLSGFWPWYPQGKYHISFLVVSPSPCSRPGRMLASGR